MNRGVHMDPELHIKPKEFIPGRWDVSWIQFFFFSFLILIIIIFFFSGLNFNFLEYIYL